MARASKLLIQAGEAMAEEDLAIVRRFDTVDRRFDTVDREIADVKTEQLRMADTQQRMADEQQRMADEQQRIAKEQRRMAEDIRRIAEAQRRTEAKLNDLRDTMLQGFAHVGGQIAALLEVLRERITIRRDLAE